MEDQEEYLVSFTNILSGFFQNQSNFLDPESLKDYYNKPYKGVPLCLPKNIKYFNYKNAIYFKIDKKNFSKKIFGTSDLKYIEIKNISDMDVFLLLMFQLKKISKKIE